MASVVHFMARSNLFSNAFKWEESLKVDISIIDKAKVFIFTIMSQ